jgi:hypothetical protein
MFLVSGKRGQVWVETAIYTLIGLTVIAIVYLTEEYGSRYNIFLSLEYEDFDIVNNGNDDKRVLNAAGVAYEIKIENLGFDEGSGKIKLDVGVI